MLGANGFKASDESVYVSLSKEQDSDYSCFVRVMGQARPRISGLRDIGTCTAYLNSADSENLFQQLNILPDQFNQKSIEISKDISANRIHCSRNYTSEQSFIRACSITIEDLSSF